MWRPTRSRENQGFTGSVYAVGQNGSSGYAPVVKVQPQFTEMFEALYSDESTGRKDKVCEHYRSLKQVFKSDFTYAQSSYSTPSGGPWNKWLCDVPGFNWGYMSTGGFSYPYGRVDDPSPGLPILYVNAPAGSHRVTVEPANVEELVQRALTSMLPGIRPRMSLVNSVYELKDFKSMARGLLSASKTFKRMLTHSANLKLDAKTRLRRILQREALSFQDRSYTLKRIVRGAADGYLQWMFALAPLVRDIDSVRESIKRVPVQVAQLLDREGKDSNRHWRFSLSDTYASKTESYESGALPYGVKNRFVYKRYTNYVSPCLNVSLAYTYKLRDWERQEAALRGYLDALGVQVNPAILWNALPWSFVVDWVFGVSQWLDQFKIRNIEPQTYIQRCCASVHVQRMVRTTYQSIPDPAFGCGTNEIPVCQVDEEAYYRFPCWPDIVRSITESGLSSTEFSLAAALGAARLK